MATLVQVRRSAPRSPGPPGARLCVTRTRNGRMSGSVSGGCVEADVFERAVQVIQLEVTANRNHIACAWAIEDPSVRDTIVQTVDGEGRGISAAPTEVRVLEGRKWNGWTSLIASKRERAPKRN